MQIGVCDIRSYCERLRVCLNLYRVTNVGWLEMEGDNIEGGYNDERRYRIGNIEFDGRQY